jgi:DHA2 family methylenomycin A resistance protein-like MFS transporter
LGYLGLLVPPPTSTLLGSVEKARSGFASGVVKSTRRTAGVLGVTLVCSLVDRPDTFVAGVHIALIVSACLQMAAAVAILFARPSRQE